MMKLWRKYRQHRCWVRGGKDESYCRFFLKYTRFGKGACIDCKHNPKNSEVAE